MIAYLGTGLLGSAFVQAFRKRGEAVHVWNRSGDKAKALEQFGARAFERVEDAVRGAARVHLTLSDDAAVDEVLERAWPALDPDAVIVDHTTTSPALTKRRAERWQARGVAFMHAPVFMGPAAALNAAGVMIASGDGARFAALAPHLEKMTGKLVYLGEDPSRAAAIKLMGNHFWVVMGTGIADTFALAKAMGVPREEVAHLFEYFTPGASIPGRVAALMEGDFSHPSWNLAMARKDVRLMLEAADAGHVPLSALPGIAANMDAWLVKGHAEDDWTVTASEVVK